uniref:CD109 molecule n=1 Tax=Cynoglossus semilaevis TaxID=244447 RepID=A0A3P8V2E1_CYNSE
FPISHAPSYLLVAPSTVRPGVPTSVSVTVLGSSSLHVSANISNGGNVLSSGVVIVEGGKYSLEFITFTIPVLQFDFSHQWGMELEVKGHSDSGLVFHNRTELNVDLKGVSTFIQTDKANYRPGQKVKFRVVSIHPDGKPAIVQLDSSSSLIQDPKENLLRQWESEDGELGVVSLDFQLSEIPPLGNWTIHATVDVVLVQMFSSFSTVLPKFKVWIDTLLRYSRGGRDVSNLRSSLPRNGGDVHGTQRGRCSRRTQEIHHNFLEFHFYFLFQINGMTDFSFLIPENYPMRKRAVDFLNKEYISVFVNKHRYKLSFYDYPKILRPLLYFVGRLTVSQGYLRTEPSDCSSQASFGDSHRTLQLYRILWWFRLKVRSRGQVVSAGTSSSVLDLLPEHSWAPEACVIVFCVLPSGEIVTDKITLELSFSTNTTSPGEPVTLTVKVMEPGSLVGLLVVDQSSAWMGSNNDITKEKVKRRQMTSSSSFFLFSIFSDPWCPHGVLLRPMVSSSDPWCPPETHGVPMVSPSDQTCKHQNMDLLTSTPPELEPRVRRNFPETWIWMDLHLGDSDTRQIPVEAPDTITTWVATAFVMSQSLGLGIIREPVELTVFQDFFLSLNLPAYLIRGEEVVLEVVLYNYLPQDLQVKVIVAANHAFHFVLHNDDALPSHSVHLVSVGGQDGALVLVPIKPVVLGEVVISVSARSTVAADAVTRKPEGLEQSFSTSMLFEVFPYQPTVSKNVQFIFPPDVVEGSQRVTVTAVGDILGPSINGLESLIKLPYGCGEQNMINFAPNIYVLQYLEVTGQTTTDIRRRAIQSMNSGYMQELSYQRRDGSFSAFGDSDPSGSTWLTAFVIRCFMQAKLFIVIDQNVVRVSGNWLSFQQAADGSFLEPGRVIHTELQGGLGGSTALTAYVLIALLENTYHTQASAALMFLEERLSESSISSTYVLSLVAYALSLAQSPNAHMAVNELIGRASITDGVPLWSPLSPREPRSADIEMVSYLLLSLYRLERISEGVAIMKWLSQQRNSFGGYGSTQDTVVALQALSTFASHGGAITNNLNLEVLREDGERVAVFFIHQDNYLLLQSDQVHTNTALLSVTPQYTVTASGQGLAVFQLNVFYNIKSEELMRRKREAQDDEAFNLHVELHDLEKEDSPHLSESSGLNSTGMAILDIGLLSGLSLAQDGIQTNEVVKKVETEPGKVIVYLDYVRVCVCVCVCACVLAKVQGAVVSVYDYYEPGEVAVLGVTGV